MNLYTGMILHIYEWTELPVDNNFIEQVNQIYSYGKGQLVKYKYSIFEWAPGTPISDETQEEAPYIINEDELYVADIAINNDDNVQEEYEDDKYLNIIEENQEPVN